MLSMYRFSYSPCDIHLHTSMMYCFGFVIISWSIFFSSFSRDRYALSIILLGGGNLESTSSVGGGLGGL